MKNFSVFALISLLLLGCHKPKSHNARGQQTYTIHQQAGERPLYFTGTIEPIQESSVSSPVAAVVEKIYSHYGQAVKKGDLIVTLNSEEYQRQYNETLTDYLKAKDNYTVVRAKFSGMQNLWDAGLISKNNFISEKSNLQTARITLLQVTRKLSDMLEKMDDGETRDLSKLSIAEFDKVRQALSAKHNLIHLKAPSSGILLYPPKFSEDKKGQLTVGAELKASEALALVGDLSGLRVEIEVPEIDILKIKPGMKAIVSGIALGNQRLEGELVRVNAQAIKSANNALPSFHALIEVKKLTKAQHTKIKIGMSAAVTLFIDTGKTLRIPIAAIHQEKGQAMVVVQNQDGSKSPRRITTGTTFVDTVAVSSGLKEGEVLLYG